MSCLRLNVGLVDMAAVVISKVTEIDRGRSCLEFELSNGYYYGIIFKGNVSVHAYAPPYGLYTSIFL